MQILATLSPIDRRSEISENLVLVLRPPFMSSMHPAVTKDITNRIMAQTRILFAGSPAATSRGPTSIILEAPRLQGRLDGRDRGCHFGPWGRTARAECAELRRNRAATPDGTVQQPLPSPALAQLNKTTTIPYRAYTGRRSPTVPASKFHQWLVSSSLGHPTASGL